MVNKDFQKHLSLRIRKIDAIHCNDDYDDDNNNNNDNNNNYCRSAGTAKTSTETSAAIWRIKLT